MTTETLIPTASVPWDDKQLEAIDACCDTTKRIVCVSGPAGSGKTKIIEEVNRRLKGAGYIVQASAPTGKAAKRINEATGLHAMTNHRMLGYGMPIEHDEVDEKTGDTKKVLISTGPTYHQRNRFPYDVIACDEYMMVNTTINRELINAMKDGSRILCFGDENQLKPIEEGRYERGKEPPPPFLLSLNNPKITGIRLDTIHRTGEGSGIAKNAKAILAGRFPSRAPDFDLCVTDQPVKLLQELVRDKLQQGIDFSKTYAQIITPQNKSWTGTIKLNGVLQSLFWERSLPPFDLPRRPVYNADRRKSEPAGYLRVQVGTKVVYTANTYDMGDGQSVFNGEVGIVVDIDHDIGIVSVDFGDRVVGIPPLVIYETTDGTKEMNPHMHIDLAYALTTHKMQGSECPHVVVVLNRSMLFTESRRNFYTAVSRSREHCTVITDQVSLTKSVRNPD